ncbi:MAG: ATP-binding protein, partial [Caldimonas sp.]
KYTPPTTRVRISARAEEGAMHVTVADDGPGIRAGQEQAIFEKFTRGARESTVAGVGLGLAICKAIVEAHGGTIAASNAPGGGAVFDFSLPLGTPPGFDAGDEAPDQVAVATEPAATAS